MNKLNTWGKNVLQWKEHGFGVEAGGLALYKWWKLRRVFKVHIKRWIWINNVLLQHRRSSITISLFFRQQCNWFSFVLLSSALFCYQRIICLRPLNNLTKQLIFIVCLLYGGHCSQCYWYISEQIWQRFIAANSTFGLYSIPYSRW